MKIFLKNPTGLYQRKKLIGLAKTDMIYFSVGKKEMKSNREKKKKHDVASIHV